jgi:hypothetical protein
VQVAAKSDVKWSTLQPPPTLPEPLPEVKADPARLAKWKKDQEALYEPLRASLDSFDVLEATGCGHTVLLGCKRPAKSNGSSRIICQIAVEKPVAAVEPPAGASAHAAIPAIASQPPPLGALVVPGGGVDLREHRTHDVRGARITRLRALARGSKDKALLARVDRADARETERHRACSGSREPSTATELRGTRFETSPCAGRYDGTDPYDLNAIAAGITPGTLRAELESLEDELLLSHDPG